MSIIERAAELLRSAPQEQPSRPAAREKGDVRSLDLIERSSAQFADYIATTLVTWNDALKAAGMR